MTRKEGRTINICGFNLRKRKIIQFCIELTLFILALIWLLNHPEWTTFTMDCINDPQNLLVSQCDNDAILYDIGYYRPFQQKNSIEDFGQIRNNQFCDCNDLQPWPPAYKVYRIYKIILPWFVGLLLLFILVSCIHNRKKINEFFKKIDQKELQR